MTAEYALIKAEADRVCLRGIGPSRSRFRTPVDQLVLGITYLAERELGHDGTPYAEAIKQRWKNGQVLSLDGSGHFGYHALVFDWIFDSLTREERTRYGNALGPWLRWYTDTPEITLKYGHWRYNQTWGPAHLNTPNTRDGITPKLLVALAIRGAGTDYEDDAKRFLDSWANASPRSAFPLSTRWAGCGRRAWGTATMGPSRLFLGPSRPGGRRLARISSSLEHQQAMIEFMRRGPAYQRHGSCTSLANRK